MAKIPVVMSHEEDDLELIDKALQIYAIVKNLSLRQFERRVLKYYVKLGCCDLADQMYIETEGRKKSDLKVARRNLRELGMLELDKYNRTKSNLTADMENFKKHFSENKSGLLLISFINPKL